jgi:hypothetical protein
MLAGEPVALQGDGPVLSLVVAQVPDDLDGEDLVRAPENLIDRLSVVAGRYLKG